MSRVHQLRDLAIPIRRIFGEDRGAEVLTLLYGYAQILDDHDDLVERRLAIAAEDDAIADYGADCAHTVWTSSSGTVWTSSSGGGLDYNPAS